MSYDQWNKANSPNDRNTKRKSLGFRPPSLRNIGANCYLNSALQGLSSCDKFVSDITDVHEEYGEVQNVSVFYKLISILNGGSDSGCMEISRNPIFRNWNKPGQQDSFELLSYILNEVYKEIRKHQVRKGKLDKRDLQSWLKISLPMRMIIEYKIKCECGSIIDVPLQSDLALHVWISKENIDLQTMVDEFFNDNEIQDYDCSRDGCDGRNAIRSTRLRTPLPRTICVHLQRARWNGHNMEKVDSNINFSNKVVIKSKFLSVGKYVSDSKDSTWNTNNLENSKEDYKKPADNTIEDNDGATTKRKSNESKAFDIDQKDKSGMNEDYVASRDSPERIKDNHISFDKTEDVTFNLTSVIVHYGSVYFGHYVCYKYVNDRWFLTNDSSVHEVSEKEVFNCQAYILFYEKP